MNSPNPPVVRNALPPSFYANALASDDEVLAALMANLDWNADTHVGVEALARDIVRSIRAEGETMSWLDALLHEYELTTQEGTALMCLAEAILRIPDRATADALIADKIAKADWESHLRDGQSSLFVNAGTWGLLLSGKLLRAEEQTERSLTAALQRVLAKGGEPIVRQAIGASVRVLGRKFIVGRSIDNALDKSRELASRGYRFSYDMLGEGAKTTADAAKYYDAYVRALDAVGRAANGRGPIAGPGISVKLSALHPRYEWTQRERVRAELTPMLFALAQRAKAHNVGMTIDAEEADRLELSLEILAALCAEPTLAGWNGLGLAIQAYQKRGLDVVHYVVDLARTHTRKLMVRLVKGAYWDTEIKRAQERGLAGYPVFTRKPSTDLSYLACARAMLAASDVLYSQFATHNAYTVAAVLTLAGDKSFEFQKLYGMGDTLHEEVYRRTDGRVQTRIYAPVGGYQELLPYLVRRLLENGANSSFVNQLSDPGVNIDSLVADPIEQVQAAVPKANPRIRLPRDLYGEERRNSCAFDLSDPRDIEQIGQGQRDSDATTWTANPIVSGKAMDGKQAPVINPAQRQHRVGYVVEAQPEHIEAALVAAQNAWRRWDATSANSRALAFERAADSMEARMPLLMGLITREAGKTIPDAQAEVREAADFCRYYALEARRKFSAPISLPGPTGERNSLQLEGRGVFLCVSPWNFPLAIFTGQVTAALAAGNAVIAKPAEQTPLIAAAAVRILHEAGVPPDVLHLLPGTGETVGAALTRDPRIAGIAFTGGTDTARAIARTLAERPGPLIPFIAETGGLNAMIVDSSALPEQVTGDALVSAFGSAGQRCSALRLLLLQDNIAARVMDMLAGAIAELRVGDPAKLKTDVGPMIDEAALALLRDHAERLHGHARALAVANMTPECERGTFFAPRAFELDDPAQLTREVFGPILHVARYRAADLERVVDAVNATGYGLTFGMHSRIDSKIAQVAQRIRAGNVYINRGMTGAVVGAQPFGGEGLSGTGPKAGGPHYLLRFASEKVVSINTTAAGGNATLLAMS